MLWLEGRGTGAQACRLTLVFHPYQLTLVQDTCTCNGVKYFVCPYSPFPGLSSVPGFSPYPSCSSLEENTYLLAWCAACRRAQVPACSLDLLATAQPPSPCSASSAFSAAQDSLSPWWHLLGPLLAHHSAQAPSSHQISWAFCRGWVWVCSHRYKENPVHGLPSWEMSQGSVCCLRC